MTTALISIAVIILFLALTFAWLRYTYLREWRKDIRPGYWVRFCSPAPWYMDDPEVYGRVTRIDGDTLTVEAEGVEYKLDRAEARP